MYSVIQLVNGRWTELFKHESRQMVVAWAIREEESGTNDPIGIVTTADAKAAEGKPESFKIPSLILACDL